MTHSDPDSLLPPIGTVPASERMLRANWLSAIERSPSGKPLLWPEFVARQGRSVHIVDVREPEELVGPLGHIPGSDWVPPERVPSLVERLGKHAKIVLVSRAGERSGPLAAQLEALGMPFVGSMIGGIVAWRYLGFATTRDASILSRRDVVRPHAEPTPHHGVLSLADVESHVGDPTSVRWMKMAAILLHGRQSCVDGRDETAIVGTPGGDAGELLLGLSAVEAVSGEKLTPLQIRTILGRRLGTLGRFYLHGDVGAANALIASMRGDRRLESALSQISETMQWRRFFASPPAHVREIVMEHTLVPAHIGCGHLRLMATRPEVYGARPELVFGLLEAFFRARWDGAIDAEFTALPGGHEEGAVLDVRLDEELRAFTSVPLISPLAQGTQTFVSHPEVASYLRADIAHFLSRQTDALRVGPPHAPAIAQAMEAMAATQTAATLGTLAAGLPIYRVSFGRGGSFHVAEAGLVPGTRGTH
ncbi:MAG: rhodanese-like domain-containing protein [Sandaracinaceae bacterium]|nr:rhodanese-like domain-containing protein [Sandaracinaceae bacterium]